MQYKIYVRASTSTRRKSADALFKFILPLIHFISLPTDFIIIPTDPFYYIIY